MIPGVLVLVYALAVARVTRLITADKLTEAPRRWLAVRLWTPRIPSGDVQRLQRDNWYWAKRSAREVRRHLAAEWYDAGAEPPLLVYLLTCGWCASIYVAAVAAPLAYFWGASPWLFVPALALAFSYVTGKLGE